MLRHLWLFGLLVVCHPLSDDVQLEAGDPEQLPSQLDSSSHSSPMAVSPCDEHQAAAVSNGNHAETTPNPHLQMNASAEQDSNPGRASDSVAPALVSDDQPVIVVAHDIRVTPIQSPISSTDSGHSPPSPPLPPTTAAPEDTPPPPPSHPADTSQSGAPPPPPEEQQQQQDATGDGVDADETAAPPRLIIELNDPESVADIPTFNEWASKKVEETEKLSNGGALPSLSASDSSSSAGAGAAASPPLLLHVHHRQKNHASPDCSAKVLAANSESSQAHNVLSPVRDDYMLNPCNARNVFIVLELCEPVQVSRVELSNDELYSSSVRQFAVSVSDRYPTRDWRRVGIFTAEEKRGLQTFNITSNIISKFLRLDILSHYAGAGHYYCTLSSVRVFGANEYEVLDHQDAIHDSTSATATATEVAVDEDDHETVDSSEKSPNIFHMAVEVVTTMVASATQAFSSEKRRSVQLCHSFDTDRLPADTPAVAVQQLSCHWQQLQQLLWHSVFVRRALLVCRLCDSLATSACHASPHCTFALSTLSPQRLHLLCLALSIHRDYSPSLPKNSRRPSPALPTNSSCPPAKSSHNNNSNNNSTYTAGAHSAFPVAGGGGGGGGGHRDGSAVASEELEEKETAAVAVTEAEEEERKTSAAANLSLVSSDATDSGGGGAAGGGGGDGGQPDVNERPQVETGGSDSVSPPPPQQQQQEEETEEGSAVTTADSAVNSSTVPSSESRLPAAADTTNWSDTKTATTTTNNNDATAPATAAATEDESGSVEDESSAGAAGQPLKLKESAFVRLGHRIRVLERNMSLSSQYLEELSRRYRRQVEDMQRTFNLTIAALESTAREAELRDNLQQEMIRSLQIQLMDLSDVVRVLVAEKDQTSWAMLQRHLVLMALEVCVLGVAYCCCIRHLKHHHQQQQQQPRQQQQQQRQQQQQQQLQRRQSTSGVTQGAVNRAKRKQTVAGVAVAGAQSNRHHRTASDETVYISGCCNPAKTARQSPATLGETVAASEATRASSLRELSSATEAAAAAEAGGQRNGAGGCHSSAGLLFGTDSADSRPVTSHTRPAFQPRARTLLSHNQYSLLSDCHSAASPAVTAARFGNPSNGHTSHLPVAGQTKKFKQRERFSIPKRHL